jgi:hypothetical protein
MRRCSDAVTRGVLPLAPLAAMLDVLVPSRGSPPARICCSRGSCCSPRWRSPPSGCWPCSARRTAVGIGEMDEVASTGHTGRAVLELASPASPV